MCGLSESLPCSHVDFCAAVTNEEGECTCPAFFIPVNIDDDDGDGVEDRNDPDVSADDEPAGFRLLGLGDLCCCWTGTGLREADVTLNAIDLRCEPITTDTDLQGNLYNPVCCVLGRPSKFRIVIEPSDLMPDDDIVWHVSGPGAVALSPARGTEVSVTPSVAGEYTLEVEIDGYDGPPPFIKFKGVTETVTSVRAWILGDGVRYSRTEAEVRTLFDDVNAIYRQAGMRFAAMPFPRTGRPFPWQDGHLTLRRTPLRAKSG